MFLMSVFHVIFLPDNLSIMDGVKYTIKFRWPIPAVSEAQHGALTDPLLQLPPVELV